MERKIKVNFNEGVEDAIIAQYLNEIGAKKPLSAEEEAALSLKIQQGDQRALQQLVEANLKFVVKVAKEYQRESLPFLDIVAEGNIGLMNAARKFNASSGKDFRSYAVWDIRRQIEHALKIESKASIIQGDTANTDSNTSKTAKTQKSPETVGSHYAVQPGIIYQQQDRDILENAIRRLPDREAMVMQELMGIYEPALTMAEAALKHNLKRERVRQIRDRAMRRLKRLKN